MTSWASRSSSSHTARAASRCMEEQMRYMRCIEVRKGRSEGDSRSRTLMSSMSSSMISGPMTSWMNSRTTFRTSVVIRGSWCTSMMS